MKYVYINDDRIVTNVILEEDPRFPGVPVDARYSKAFLARCLEVADTVEVTAGNEYLPVQNVFVPPLVCATLHDVETGGEPVTLPVSYSDAGTWEVESTTVEVRRDEDTLVIPPFVSGEIKLRFTETKYGRVLLDTIKVRTEDDGHHKPVEPGEEEEEPVAEGEPTTREILNVLLGVSE